MISKILKLSFYVFFLASTTVNGLPLTVLTCPNLMDWDGHSNVQSWKLLKSEDTKGPWYAYEALIYTQPTGPYFIDQAQCIYVNVKAKSNLHYAKKIIFGKHINPEDYRFKRTQFLRLHPQKKRCSPWKVGLSSPHLFPTECQFIPNTY